MNEKCGVQYTYSTTSYYVRRLSPTWLEPSEKAWYVKKPLQGKSKTACEATYVCNNKNRKKMKICWTNRFKIMQYTCYDSEFDKYGG